jgi:large subunit ribosomal protein L15
MPLVRRVPKFGFKSPFRVEYQVVNVGTLAKLAKDGKLADGKVTPEVLYAIGAISKRFIPVKILGEGEVTTALEITAHAFSKSAQQKIEHVSGKAVTISRSMM